MGRPAAFDATARFSQRSRSACELPMRAHAVPLYCLSEGSDIVFVGGRDGCAMP
jgi:hypothetical protein